MGVSSTGDNTQTPAILGDTFLRNFVTTFDYEKEKMYTQVSMAAAQKGANIYYKMSVWSIICIILACLIFLIVLYQLIVCCLRKKKQRA